MTLTPWAAINLKKPQLNYTFAVFTQKQDRPRHINTGWLINPLMYGLYFHKTAQFSFIWFLAIVSINTFWLNFVKAIMRDSLKSTVYNLVWSVYTSHAVCLGMFYKDNRDKVSTDRGPWRPQLMQEWFVCKAVFCVLPVRYQPLYNTHIKPQGLLFHTYSSIRTILRHYPTKDISQTSNNKL